MNITLIYDSEKEMSQNLVRETVLYCEEAGHTLKIFDAGIDALAPCLGCFDCWLKTPGICVHRKDRGEEFLKSVINSDFYFRISEIRWGGYTASIKNYTDRTIPLIHPFFKKLGGEMHHRPRYKHYPRMLVAGWGAVCKEEEETFLKLYRANLMNFNENGPALPLILKGEEEGAVSSWLVTETGGCRKMKEAAE